MWWQDSDVHHTLQSASSLSPTSWVKGVCYFLVIRSGCVHRQRRQCACFCSPSACRDPDASVREGSLSGMSCKWGDTLTLQRCHVNEGTHSHFDSHYSPPASFISAARLRMHLTFFFFFFFAGGGGGGGDGESAVQFLLMKQCDVICYAWLNAVRPLPMTYFTKGWLPISLNRVIGPSKTFFFFLF